MQDLGAASEPRRSICDAYILENSVFHARHLPASSKHAFKYPTLALLLRLSSLESHSLDLCSGRLFGYSDPGSRFSWARITGIRPEAYLHDPESSHSDSDGVKGSTIREKLNAILRRFKIDPSDVEDAWMLTMPSYLGLEGINPLTVYFCYEGNGIRGVDGVGQGDLALSVVVLEVHNTFGERHAYVLRVGAGCEDKQAVSGYTHSWTFPRQFHVSPFNERCGFYTCSLVPPPPPHSSFKNSPCLPKILIQLRTPEDELKLTASLRSTFCVPLNTRNVLATLVRYPLTLLLSFPRIAWQAFHLHYSRNLEVYARPEPRAVCQELENAFSEADGAGDNGKMTRNHVQRENGQLGTGGGTGWQPEGPLEMFSRRRIERFLDRRCQEIGIRVSLVSTNPAYPMKEFPNTSLDGVGENPGPKMRELTILTRSPRAFLLILASPSPKYALLLARDAEGLIVVSDENSFLEVFSIERRETQSSGSVMVERLLRRLRQLPIPHNLLRDPELTIPEIHPLDVDVSFIYSRSPPEQSSLIVSALGTLAVISAFIVLTYLERVLFVVSRARFVKGTEPWGLWDRAEAVWSSRGDRRDERGEESGVS